MSAVDLGVELSFDELVQDVGDPECELVFPGGKCTKKAEWFCRCKACGRTVLMCAPHRDEREGLFAVNRLQRMACDAPAGCGFIGGRHGFDILPL